MISSYRQLILPLLVFVALGAASLIFAPAAEACMTFSCSDCCYGCGTCYCDSSAGYCECGPLLQSTDSTVDRITTPRSVELVFTGPRTASIVLPNYSTTSLQPATHCVTALSPVPGVDSVDRVLNFDGRTGKPFEEVSFYSAPSPGAAIAKLADEQGVADAENGAWYAFQSHIIGTVRNGVPNFFVVEVTLEPEISKAQFVEAVRQDGLFLTSSSDENGVPTDHHSTFRQIGAAELVVRGMDSEDPAGAPTAPRQQ